MPFTVTLSQSQRRFPVNANESVLDGAQRADLSMPWRCRRGDCGSCRARVLDGHTAPIWGDETGEEVDPREVRLCSVRATTDLVIAAREVLAVEDVPCRRVALEVVELTQLAPQVMDVALAADPSAALRWLPGQYLELILDDGSRRAFSIANAQVADPHLHLHVRHVAGGSFTRAVFEELKVGDRFAAEAPIGTFVPREGSDRPMIFVAGGTGFAPIRAIVQHFLALGSTRPMHLYWGARRAEDLYLRHEAEDWMRQAPWLHFHGVLSEADGGGDLRRGLVHEAVVADHPRLAGYEVYLCGPPAMIDAGRHAFFDAGLPESRLYFDTYEYAPDVLADILGERAGIAGR
ncbi:MAG TPA: 2Fe-2S iron-sulfur cluster-binding protein [Rhodanobacteraceae bacterium]|nr:2Fe-2S iron-sulfur cluster-binding protein [Rhodanobacteraceae bacterium]